MRNTACLQTIAQITEGFPPGGGSQGCPYTGWVLCWLVAFLRHLGGCWHRHGKQRRSCFSSQPKRGCFHVGLGKSRPWNRTDEVMWVMDKVSCRRISAGGSPHLVAWHWFLGFCSFRHRDMNFGMTKGIIWFLLSGWKIVNRSFLDDTPPLICNFKWIANYAVGVAWEIGIMRHILYNVRQAQLVPVSAVVQSHLF